MSDAKIINFNGNGIKGVIDDGTQAIPIENKFGKKICTIYIRPGDLSIIDRYKKVIADMPAIVKPLEDLSIASDGTTKAEDEWDVIKQVEAKLYELLNFLFDMDEAEDIFATRNPFSSIHGRFFCELVIEAIGGIIEQTIEQEAKQSRARTEKYLDDLNSAKAQPEVDADVRESTDNA